MVSWSRPEFAEAFFGKLVRRRCIYATKAALDSSPFVRVLGLLSLVSLGVGAVVGAGIFVITGQVAAQYAGPGLTISFVLCMFPCFLTALCYGELAAMLPVAGSAYTHTSVALGEFASWTVAVCMTLECLVSGCAVSVSWSAYVQAFLKRFSFVLPQPLRKSPIDVVGGRFVLTGSVVNFPAVVITVVCFVVLCLGVEQTASMNSFFVVVKLAALVCFVFYGIYYSLGNWAEVNANLTPFVPPNDGHFGHFGVSGILRGASVVFFANVGFDTICASAQECRSPQRDIPRGIILTLLLCSTLYVMVTVSLTGLVKYTELGTDAPVIAALEKVKAPSFLRLFIEVGTVAALSSVCFVSFYAMPRLIMAVAKDGLLPALLTHVHEQFRTPINATIFCGIPATFICAVFPLGMLGELISFGTLIALACVCVSMWKIRIDHPEFHRPFVAPLFPYVPILGALLNAAQLFFLPLTTWRNYFVVMATTSLWYIVYGIRHSTVGEDGITRRPDSLLGTVEPPLCEALEGVQGAGGSLSIELTERYVHN
ncbi:cationic amino acid transporter, putative [Trypanosoma equiperdum]|uniref:Cationic amino acid transporter, putative n=1 Tax=Trypanosoma equiperdum TaxID=5694 RepID=A0A1G4I4U5_TRYEQ|nr:cationic amino acid transporter, putative [Trypanosoma equiperdum]